MMMDSMYNRACMQRVEFTGSLEASVSVTSWRASFVFFLICFFVTHIFDDDYAAALLHFLFYFFRPRVGVRFCSKTPPPKTLI